MSIWKDRDRKKWRYQFQFQGQRYSSGYLPTRAAAQSEMAEHRKSLKSTAGKQTQAGMDFKTAASLYLDYSERKHAKKTFKYKRYVFALFSKLHGATPVDQITPQQILSFLNTRPTNDNFNRHLKEFSTLFVYAKKILRVIHFNPCENLDRMPYSPAKKIIPTEQDVLKLIAAANPKTDERDLLMVVLMTLARIDEVLRLSWDDVNFTTSTVRLWTRKRKDGNLEADILPMNQDLNESLHRMWEKRTQNNWVFLNPLTKDRYMHRPHFMPSLCKKAGIQPIGFHALRHFMASFLADRQKISKMTISRLLRHKSLGTTERYLQSIGEGQRDAMDSVSGIFCDTQGVDAACASR